MPLYKRDYAVCIYRLALAFPALQIVVCPVTMMLVIFLTGRMSKRDIYAETKAEMFVSRTVCRYIHSVPQELAGSHMTDGVTISQGIDVDTIIRPKHLT